MDRIIALIDASPYADSVLAYTAWAARETGYGADLLHVVTHRAGRAAPVDLTGNLTLGARSSLMESLTKHDEDAARLGRERGRALIDAACDEMAGYGIDDVRARLRTGGLVEAVGEVEAEARLLVIGKRGEHADFASGHLGSNLERIVRAAHRPVLVCPRAASRPERAVIAFDTGPSIAKAVDHIARGKLFTHTHIHLLHAGEETREIAEGLESARTRLEAAGYGVSTAIQRGEPERVISAEVSSSGGDILVMGAYGHSRIRSLIIGSTTTEMIRACRAPVLLFRPDMEE